MFEFKPETIPPKFQPTKDWPKGRLTELLGDARKNGENAFKTDSPKAEARDAKPQDKPEAKAKAEQPAQTQARQNQKPDAQMDALDDGDAPQAKEPAELKQATPKPTPDFTPTVAPGVLSMLVNQKANAVPHDDISEYKQGDEFKLGKGGYGLKKRLEEDRQEQYETSYGGSKSERMAMQNYAQWQLQQQQLEQRAFKQTFENFIATETQRLALKEKEHEENIVRLNEELKVAEAERDESAAALEETRGKITENNKVIETTSAAISSTEADIAKLEKDAKRNEQQIKDQQAIVDKAAAAVDGANAAAIVEAANAETQETRAQDMATGTEVYVDLAKKARAEAEQLDQKIEKAETTLLKDEKGQSVHQDEKGNLYSLDTSGKKQEYTAEEQQKLKEKLEKEGLVTADTLEKMRQDRDQLLKNAKVYEDASGWTESQKDRALDSAERARVASTVYTKIAGDLNTELEGHKDRLRELRDEGRLIKQELNEKSVLLASLKEKLEQAKTTGAQLTEQERLQLEDLTRKEQRVKDIRGELATEHEALKKVKQDADALKKANEKYNSPEMQERLNSSDPAVQKAAREELMNSLPPEMQTRIKKEWQAAEQQLKQASPPAPASNAPPAAENTSRTASSAAPSGINTSTQNVTSQYNSAAAGTTAPANEPAPSADEELVYANSATPKTTAGGIHP